MASFDAFWILFQFLMSTVIVGLHASKATQEDFRDPFIAGDMNKHLVYEKQTAASVFFWQIEPPEIGGLS